MSKVRDWLEANRLGKHADLFEENDIDFDLLPRLTKSDVDELGLSVGAKRRLLDALSILSGETDCSSAPNEPATAPTPTRHNSNETAERRQLAAIFRDLVGSTALSQRFAKDAPCGLMGSKMFGQRRGVTGAEGRVTLVSISKEWRHDVYENHN